MTCITDNVLDEPALAKLGDMKRGFRGLTFSIFLKVVAYPKLWEPLAILVTSHSKLTPVMALKAFISAAIRSLPSATVQKRGLIPYL
jgi:hypothetical protein